MDDLHGTCHHRLTTRYFANVPQSVNNLLLYGILPEQREIVTTLGLLPGKHQVGRCCCWWHDVRAARKRRCLDVASDPVLLSPLFYHHHVPGPSHRYCRPLMCN